MKEKVEHIFVVLTYINSDDLEDFIDSVKEHVKDYRIIVVNSYHDEESLKRIQAIAELNECDFKNVPNKGYSYGNNQGIQMALEKYEFKYLVISNADINVVQFNTSDLGSSGIYCGKIVNLRGKMQNPMLVCENKVSDCLINQAYIRHSKILLVAGIGLNKVIRELFLLCNKKLKKSKRIYQAHGSFIIFTKNSILKLGTVFDENVFLFGEEGILAKRAKKIGVPIYYTSSVYCRHKEDGSMKLFDGNLNQEYEKSNIYYYEEYCKK